MKKVLLTMVLIAGFTVCAYAEHPSAEHPKAVPSAATEEAIVNSSIEFLLNNGVSADEAKNIIEQAVTEAKAQGLEGDELAAKVTEAAQAHIAAKSAEHPAAASEHPAAGSEHPATGSEHPSEHPGR